MCQQPCTEEGRGGRERERIPSAPRSAAPLTLTPARRTGGGCGVRGAGGPRHPPPQPAVPPHHPPPHAPLAPPRSRPITRPSAASDVGLAVLVLAGGGGTAGRAWDQEAAAGGVPPPRHLRPHLHPRGRPGPRRRTSAHARRRTPAHAARRPRRPGRLRSGAGPRARRPMRRRRSLLSPPRLSLLSYNLISVHMMAGGDGAAALRRVGDGAQYIPIYNIILT